MNGEKKAIAQEFLQLVSSYWKSSQELKGNFFLQFLSYITDIKIIHNSSILNLDLEGILVSIVNIDNNSDALNQENILGRIVFILKINSDAEQIVSLLRGKKILTGFFYIQDMDAILSGIEVYDLIRYKIYNLLIKKTSDTDTAYDEYLFNKFTDSLKNRTILLSDYTIQNVLATVESEEHPRALIHHPVKDVILNELEAQGLKNILISGVSASGKTSLSYLIAYLLTKNSSDIQIFFLDASFLTEDDIPGITLDLLKYLIEESKYILLIIDDLHSNLNATVKILEIVNLISYIPTISSKFKFIGIAWTEFIQEIESQLEVKPKIITLEPDDLIESIIARFNVEITSNSKKNLLKYTENNLFILNLSLKILVEKKINIEELSTAVFNYIFDTQVNIVEKYIDKNCLNRVLLLASVLGQYEIDFTTKFIFENTGINDSSLNELIRRKILRKKGYFLTLGHRSYCKILFDFLSTKTEIWEWLRSQKNLNSVADIILEYLYNLQPSQIWSILKNIYTSANINNDKLEAGNLIVKIWQNIDYLLEKIIRQQCQDPTWNQTPSSALFCVQALCQVGYSTQAKSSMDFLRSIYTVNRVNNCLDIDVSRLSTSEDFKQIKEKILEQDAEEDLFYEKSDVLDETKFHKNWVKGLILCSEAYYGNLSKFELQNLAVYVENDIKDDCYFYPARVTWCTARVLIGLGLCGRSINNSLTVKKITDWLLNHPNYRDDFWISGTGAWNTWIEVTALSVIALISVGVSPQEPKIQNAIKKLFKNKSEWIAEGKEIDGVLALQAYTLAGGNINKVLDEIKYLSDWIKNTALWINATKAATETFKQSCLVSQTASGLIDLMWRYVQTDLQTLLKSFALKDSIYRENDSLIKGENLIEIFDVFLCHNSLDKEIVKQIGEQLKKRGLNPWLDEWNLIPGRPWQRSLEEQIQTVKSAAVFVGRNGLGPWTDMEVEAFLREFMKRKCPIIPVILPNVEETPELPIFLQRMHWVDFRKQDPDPLEQLIRGITSK
jgi:hypothetical protein